MVKNHLVNMHINISRINTYESCIEDTNGGKLSTDGAQSTVLHVVDEKVSENILHKKTGKLSTPLLGPPDRTWA